MLTQTRRLPLIVALVAFAFYICTLGGGVTLNSLPLAAHLAGWDDSPMVGQPLLWLLTLPLKVLPAAWMPVLVKLFAAAMAAAILGLLTRAIQLLPWDYPWDNSSRLAGLLPVLAAVVVCGLEFNFWQEATSSCSELLGLLLLATAVWLLLEYRVRQNMRWLEAATLVWGLGMAENWAMMVTLPLFVAGVIWLMGLRILRLRIALRLVALGLAGFSIYIILPMANGLAPHSPWTLHEAWHTSLHQTKNTVLSLYYQFWRGHRLLTMAVLIYFLVPALPLVVRMRDEGTYNKSGVDIFQIWIYRCLRVALLLACLWLAFDPTVGLRQIVQHQMGASLSLLTFDYVNALGVAFLAGNLLLSRPVGRHDTYRYTRTRYPWKKTVVPPAAAAVLALIAIGLAVRNAPAISRLNFHPLEEFGDVAVKSLPSGHGVVLSDFPKKLQVFQAALARHGNPADWLAVDTRALPKVEYRAQLERRQPGAGWLTENNRHELAPVETLRLLAQVATSNRLFYLHPSFGYFFEGFYLEPTGSIYEMKLRNRKDPLDVPPLAADAMEANEKFWTSLWEKDLAALAPSQGRPSGLENHLAHYGLVPASRLQDGWLAEWYSISLDNLAVNLQKQGHLREAQSHLEQALQLNSNNVSARLTLLCNSNLQASGNIGMDNVAKVAAQVGGPDKFSQIMSSDGPFDEPTFNCIQGGYFLTEGLLLQAAEQLERVLTLTTNVPTVELAMADIYNQLNMPDRSRKLINHLREEVSNRPANTSVDLQLALVDCCSSLLQTNKANARSALRAVAKQYPDDPQVVSRVLAAYMSFGDFTNALRLADDQVARNPDDATSLDNKAMVLLQSGQTAEAITIYGHILTETNLPWVRVNRAFAYLTRTNFDLAENDLRELEKDDNVFPMVDFGLATVAEHKQDTNQVAHYLRLCMTNAPAGSAIWQQASAKLRALDLKGVVR